MNIFFDTNIIIDFVLNRNPYAHNSRNVINQSIYYKHTMYLSSLSICNCKYIIEKNFKSNERAKLVTKLLLDNFKITNVDDKVIHQAFNSTFSDFEDAVQYFSAKSTSSIDMIITRDLKGFSKSDILVATPETALTILNK